MVLQEFLAESRNETYDMQGVIRDSWIYDAIVASGFRVYYSSDGVQGSVGSWEDFKGVDVEHIQFEGEKDDKDRLEEKIKKINLACKEGRVSPTDFWKAL